MHVKSGFDLEEIADKELFQNRSTVLTGPDLDLLDDNRCAFARFCRREQGDAWDLTMKSDNPDLRAEAIQGANDCPAGRLAVRSKSGELIEPNYEPAIEIIQDPERGVSRGIFVKGNIPIESSDGQLYETRSRVVLCRCGQSKNAPFCDAAHVSCNFTDKKDAI